MLLLHSLKCMIYGSMHSMLIYQTDLKCKSLLSNCGLEIIVYPFKTSNSIIHNSATILESYSILIKKEAARIWYQKYSNDKVCQGKMNSCKTQIWNWMAKGIRVSICLHDKNKMNSFQAFSCRYFNYFFCLAVQLMDEFKCNWNWNLNTKM